MGSAPVNKAPVKEPKKPAVPGAALPQPLYDRARWLNFYSKRDLLGFPLKPLNPMEVIEREVGAAMRRAQG